MAGRTCIPMSFSEDVTTTGSSTAKYPLGALRIEESSTSGRGAETYRYVYQDDADVAAAAGALCYRGTTQGDLWDVSGDVSDSDAALAVGVYQSVLGNAKYGWVKTKGYEASLKKRNGAALNWVLGDFLITSDAASQDGMAENWEAVTQSIVTEGDIQSVMQRPVGYAATVATSTATSGAAYIELE